MPLNKAARRLELRFVLIMMLSWIVPLGMWANSQFLDPRSDYADQGAEGPFSALADGTSASTGLPRYLAGLRLDSVQAGERFAWQSSICLEEGASMRAHSELARLRDGAVVARGREVLWTPESRRCGVATGNLMVPADAEPGDYELRRLGQVRPLSWWPLNAPLRSLRLRIVAGTTR